MWNDYLYMETPDNYLVSLEAKTGKERWHKVISDFNQQYFSTMAPIVVDNHVIAGTGQRSRHARLPAVVRPGDRRAAVEALYRADERRRSGARDLAEPRRGAARRRAAVAAGRATIRKRGSTSSAPAIRRRPTRPAAAKGTTCSPARWSRCNVDTGKMAWYYQTRRTTCTTGTRRRRRCSWTRRSTGACGSS